MENSDVFTDDLVDAQADGLFIDYQEANHENRRRSRKRAE